MIATIFESASIVDGTGDAAYVTDVGIVGERIALIGDLRERDAAVRIPCNGKVLAPGFIDVHSHSDELWLRLPRCDSKIAQGVTSEIGGNCGRSPAPRTGVDGDWQTLDQFFSLVQQNGVAMNVGLLAGLGTTRTMVAGMSERRLASEEIAAQAHLVREACEQGALGISSGLIYPPSQYADREELIAMAIAAREAGAPLYASHVRNEGDTLLEAIEEAIEIGTRAEVAVQCSHHKAQGKQNWGKVHRSLALIDRARMRGLRVHADVYPYIASWTDLATILPDDVRYGGPEQTLERLHDPKTATAIALALGMRDPRSWHDMLIAGVGSERNADVVGLRLDEIAQRWRLSAPAAAIRLLEQEELDVEAIFFTMCEDDVATVLSAEFTCIGSDASIRALAGASNGSLPHPRAFGTFPRVLRRFVAGRQTLGFEEAIKRMTSLPADIFGLRDRGRIQTGRYADLVILERETVADTATYERPYSLPVGIEHVYVNGRAVISNGIFTHARPGRVLRNGAA